MKRKTSGATDVLDITTKLQENLSESAIETGQVTVFVPGSAGAVTPIECELGVVEELKKVIDRLAQHGETGTGTAM